MSSSLLPVCVFSSLFLGCLTNGCSREWQNLQLNWFGRAQALTFLADLCAATTGTLSNNPRDPNQEAEDRLYLFCTFWVIAFRFSGPERQLGAAKHRMSEAAGMMWLGKPSCSLTKQGPSCALGGIKTPSEVASQQQQTRVSPTGSTWSTLMSENMDFTEHHRPLLHLQRPLGSAFCMAACYCNISFIHIWILHWANIWPPILRLRQWNWSFIHCLVQEEMKSAACRSKYAISNGDR